jgi:hypothetical protein
VVRVRTDWASGRGTGRGAGRWSRGTGRGVRGGGLVFIEVLEMQLSVSKLATCFSHGPHTRS